MALYTASSFKSELNDKGWRMTPQRETILHVFQNLPKGNHLSAEDLYTLLKNRGENISLSTIYRTLKLMARMSLLRELELAEGHKHYEINQPYPHHHHHLVCVQCNRTIEFNNDSILKIGMKQAEKSGLHLLDCQLTIHTVATKLCGWDGRLWFPAIGLVRGRSPRTAAPPRIQLSEDTLFSHFLVRLVTIFNKNP